MKPCFLDLGTKMSSQLHSPAALPPGTHWIGGWVGPRACQRKFFTLPGLELRPVGRPSRSQSLYRPISAPIFEIFHSFFNFDYLYKSNGADA
jgi:hypothetical protein